MSLSAILKPRPLLWLTGGLTTAYALVMAHEFWPTPDITPDILSSVEWLLFAEVVFAGPMIIAVLLSILMRWVEARRVIAGFQVGYILITLAIFYSTFTGEEVAQYQLAILFIPLYGYLGIVGAGLIAACFR